jgi:hypothetical protein
VATGTPAALARQAASHTGQALAHHVPAFRGARKAGRTRSAGTGKGGGRGRKADAAD